MKIQIDISYHTSNFGVVVITGHHKLILNINLIFIVLSLFMVKFSQSKIKQNLTFISNDEISYS